MVAKSMHKYVIWIMGYVVTWIIFSLDFIVNSYELIFKKIEMKKLSY